MFWKRLKLKNSVHLIRILYIPYMNRKLAFSAKMKRDETSIFFNVARTFFCLFNTSKSSQRSHCRRRCKQFPIVQLQTCVISTWSVCRRDKSSVWTHTHHFIHNENPCGEKCFYQGILWELWNDHAKVITRQFTTDTSVRTNSLSTALM